MQLNADKTECYFSSTSGYSDKSRLWDHLADVFRSWPRCLTPSCRWEPTLRRQRRAAPLHFARFEAFGSRYHHQHPQAVLNAAAEYLWPTTLGAHQHEACQPSMASCRRTHQVWTSDPDVRCRLLATFLLTSSELLKCRLVDVFARLQPMVSSFGHRDSSSSVIVHIRSQALTCGTIFPTNEFHCSRNFPAGVNSKDVFCIVQHFLTSHGVVYWKTEPI